MSEREKSGYMTVTWMVADMSFSFSFPAKDRDRQKDRERDREKEVQRDRLYDCTWAIMLLDPERRRE